LTNSVVDVGVKPPLPAEPKYGVNLDLKELLSLSPTRSSVRPLSPKKATEVLKGLINDAVWLQGEYWASAKREHWISSARAVLERSFPPGSSIIQRFETADTFAFSPDTSDEEMRKMANSGLESAVAILRSGIDQLGWEAEEEPEPRIEKAAPIAALKSASENVASGTQAMSILHEAIRAVPAVKYALGVAGIVAAIAIIQLLRVSLVTAVFGTVVMIVLMTLLVIFARLARTTPSKLTLPAQVFTWFVLLLTIATASFLFTSVFWRWPVDLQNWIKQDARKTTTHLTEESPQETLDTSGGPLEEWQRVLILQTVAQYPGHKVLIFAGIGKETAAYAAQFRNLFEKAKWVVAGPTPAPVNQPVLDLQISIDEQIYTHPEIQAILSALKSARVKSRPGAVHNHNVAADWIVLWVGARTPENEPLHVPLDVPSGTFAELR
jgi:hypothetical protein